MKKQTWMIEGEWSGYRREQQHLVHRHYTKDKDEAEKLAKMYGIRYSDGTTLILHVIDVTDMRKRLPEVKGYCDLIQQCLAAGVDNVDALYAKSSSPGEVK